MGQLGPGWFCRASLIYLAFSQLLIGAVWVREVCVCVGGVSFIFREASLDHPVWCRNPRAERWENAVCVQVLFETLLVSYLLLSHLLKQFSWKSSAPVWEELKVLREQTGPSLPQTYHTIILIRICYACLAWASMNTLQQVNVSKHRVLDKVGDILKKIFIWQIKHQRETRKEKKKEEERIVCSFTPHKPTTYRGGHCQSQELPPDWWLLWVAWVHA